MACTNVESTVLAFPLEAVFQKISNGQLKWTGRVERAEVVSGGEGQVGSVHRLFYKDDAIQTVQIRGLVEEDSSHELHWRVLDSIPPLPVMGVTHQITLREVTLTNGTYLQWTTRFSGGAATPQVLEDSRFKKLDAFKALEAALEEDRKQLHDVWDRFAVTQFAKSFQNLPPQVALSQSELERLWERFDEDGSGDLSQGEIEKLLAATFDYMSRHVPARLKELCDYEELEDDERKQADVKLAEIQAQLAELQLEATTKACAQDLQQYLDVDGNGKVERHEFIATFQDAMQRAVRKHRLASEE